MSEGTGDTQHGHIRKKRLLYYRNEDPELNKNGLNQQDASEEPAFVLVSFDENQFKNGNEGIKVLELHANQEMPMNSYYENDFPHEQQSNAVTLDQSKIPDLKKTFSIDEDEEREEKEKLRSQININGQHHFGNPEMQPTNLFKSQINTINDENEIKNTMIGNNASMDNDLEIIHNVRSYLNENFQMISCNGRNESCQEEQLDNLMQLINRLYSEINTNNSANAIDFEPNISKSDLEQLQRYVEYLENMKKTKMDNLMKMVHATRQVLSLAEEQEQQEDLQDDKNIDNEENEDKKDFKMLVTEDNTYDITPAHNKNEYPSQSPEYQEQQKALNNFYCPKSPEEQINMMKNPFETLKIQLEKPQVENISISSISSSEYPPHMQIKSRFEADENGMVCIGPNGTMIPLRTLESLNWYLTGAAVTRKLLVEIFGRETLAAHNLTGKPSPAFIDCNKPVKGQLDPIIVADLIHFMGEQKDLTPKEVKHAIVTKCADENKMLRLKEKKRQRIAAQNAACGVYL